MTTETQPAQMTLLELTWRTMVDGDTPCNGFYTTPVNTAGQPGGGVGAFIPTFPLSTSEEKARTIVGLVQVLRAAADDIEARFSSSDVWPNTLP